MKKFLIFALLIVACALLLASCNNHDYCYNYTTVITKEPTCTTTGEQTIYCECGEVYGTEIIPSLGHDPGNDGRCKRCDNALFEFGTVEGEFGITGIDSNLTGNIVIPAKSPGGQIIKLIEPNAFFGSSITGITFEEGCQISNINGAFEYLPNLTSIVIPNSVTSIGNSAFAGCSSLESITIPDSVTSIGNSAFYGCSTLENITIPDGVTSIGEDAFYDCSSLTSITIPNGVTSISASAFAGCSSLESITIPNDVTSIGTSAFSGCSSLESITIPDGVTSIDNNTFRGCSSLENITIPDNVTSIGDSAFSVCSSLTSITIPNSVTSIGDSTFSSCSALTNITIPDNVTSIGEEAFWFCSSLTSITIPNSVTSIGEEAFCHCSALTSITIPNSVTSISKWAFSNCSALTNITIPDSVTSIGKYAFYYCSALKSITIPNSVTSIDEYAFQDCNSLESISLPFIGNKLNGEENTYFAYIFEYVPSSLKNVVITGDINAIDKSAFSNCSSLTSITIPEGVTSIGEYAFNNCSSLTSITIPNSVTSIDGSAFRDCSSLESISLPFIGNKLNGEEKTFFAYIFGARFYNELGFVPSSLKNVVITGNINAIDENAFYNCSSLTSITIPEGVTSIGEYAFNNCSSLTSIDIPEGVTSIGEYAFNKCSSLISISLPKSLTNFSNSGYTGCYSLKEIINHSSIDLTVGEGIAKYAIEIHKGESKIITWDGYIFYPYENVNYYVKRIDNEKPLLPESYNGNSYGIAPYSFCYSGINEIKLPSTITHIGRYAFYETDITSINIPHGTTYIGEYAFWSTDITNVVVPDTVAFIGFGAFKGCSISSITLPFVGESNHASGDNAKIEYIFGSGYIPSSLKEVSITSCTNIQREAFKGCTSITSITLPNNIKHIGDYAFMDCSNLENITLPSSLTSIGVSAFENCSKLTKVEIKSNVTSIGFGAFSGCSSLSEITLPYVGNTNNCVNNYWIGYIFGATNYVSNSTVIPKTLKKVEITDAAEIASLAFYGCDSITEIIIPDTVDSIGISALYGCSSLNTLTIPFVGGSRNENNYLNYLFGTDYTSVAPESLKKVILTGGSYANFSGCEYIENIVLPESVTTINIDFCSSLKSIHLSKNVTNFGFLNGLLSLEEITVDANNSNYSAINGVLYNKSGTVLYHYPSAKADPILVIPNGVTGVHDYFNNCKNLLEIIIPASVSDMYNINAPSLTKITVLNGNENYRSINGNLYSADGKVLISCAKGKTEVILAHGVTTIDRTAFSNSSITTIVIPDTVTNIRTGAFSNCENLTSIYISSEVANIDFNAFTNCKNATIYCEASSRPTGWNGSWSSGCKEIIWGYIKE